VANKSLLPWRVVHTNIVPMHGLETKTYHGHSDTQVIRGMLWDSLISTSTSIGIGICNLKFVREQAQIFLLYLAL